MRRVRKATALPPGRHPPMHGQVDGTVPSWCHQAVATIGLLTVKGGSGPTVFIGAPPPGRCFHCVLLKPLCRHPCTELCTEQQYVQLGISRTCNAYPSVARGFRGAQRLRAANVAHAHPRKS